MTNKVLLIEDEQNIIAAISFILSRDGWDVRTHSNGTTAPEAVRTRMPDVIVLDVMLPGKTGFEVLHDIRSDPVTREIPVLMLTAKGQKSDRERAKTAGADHFMTKPFSNAELLDAIRALARK